MTRSTPFLPVIRRLSDDFSIERVFSHFASRPGCLWFDSVPNSTSPVDEDVPLPRYSFLMSDPIATLVAEVGDPDPWPVLERWYRQLPANRAENLPPMQGGIAGLIGYEAATWLEQVGVSRRNDLPTPAMSLGLYDWTIAMDHAEGTSWLICQGIPEDAGLDRDPDRPDQAANQTTAQTVARATVRADEIEDQIQRALRNSVPTNTPCDHADPCDRDQVTSNFSSQEFRAAVADVVNRIRSGDSFQVNLAQRLLHPAVISSAELYRRLRVANPAPYSVYYHGDRFEVLSSSPELFLKLDGRSVQTRPIKGTVPRTGDAAEDQRLAESLQRSLKDRAENIMIVDLMRNDLSRVCRDDSVQVRKLCQVERYQFVQHLVSIVEGTLRDDCNVIDLLKACFPGGSVTGAPKIEAMRTIAELEPDRRGPYCGSMGYISCSGHAEFNILIRTVTAAGGQWQIPVGGGITARSNPASEEAETWTKAEGILRALPGPQ
ncbi:para-aminobenzoate synthase, subunit I [Rhodopirellula maiorica SM1]|uniref:Para-aminobenzoate synthase, subunit I n=1 Tax=Rhodopirellula maiorica SM1 TaxID=1265738 RepID=M5S149_9BACT|nr:anthranilate synthase component I family protein [Rhodopirellula maiorica]EMI21372.1 para-aminobenzoate synthase, subunit I [Rhodopirellula maiorica SM1]